MITIGNESVTATISPSGAELVSLRGQEGFEYLWQGDPASWSGQSPILFPIVGGLPNGEYRYDGKTYRLDPHGFARRRRFEVNESAATRAVFRLTADDATYERYPFSFVLEVCFTVHDATTRTELIVENCDERRLPFSIGGHPGLNCPFDAGQSFDDYRLIFDTAESTTRLIKANGLLTGEAEPFVLPDGTLALTHALFERGAIIMPEHSSGAVTLTADRAGRSVRVSFGEFPNLGIWSFSRGASSGGASSRGASSRGAPFVCIEPWFGYDSTIGDPPEIERKRGLVWLEPGATHRAGFDIEISPGSRDA